MSDITEESSNVAVEEQVESKPLPTMAETEEQPQLHQTQPQQHVTKKPEKMTNVSFSIWPPTQRTRDAVINRLIETLSAPSVLSKRYGSMPHDEAAEAARRIEDEAFAAATASASADDDGIEILQVYSKEISKRMLDAVKTRSASASAPDANNAAQSPVAAPTPIASEEISSVETES